MQRRGLWLKHAFQSKAISFNISHPNACRNQSWIIGICPGTLNFEIRGGKVYTTIPTILRLVCVALKHYYYCVCFARQRTLTKTPAYIVYIWYRISCRCLKDGTIATWPIINVYNINQYLGSNVIYVKCDQRIKALSNLEI